MIAGGNELVVLAGAGESSSILFVHQPTMEELGSAVRYDIRTGAGVLLWREITLADIPHLIQLRRAQASLNPEWMQELVAHPSDAAAVPQVLEAKVDSTDAVTLTLFEGQVEELRYCGGTLSLGFDNIEIDVRTPTRRAMISLEQALRHLDRFEHKTRARLVAGVEFWFDRKLDRGAE